MSFHADKWMTRALARWEPGTIMLAPDDESEGTDDLKGRCWAIVHERYERAIYAMLAPGETVDDLKQQVASIRPDCVVLAASGPNTGYEPHGKVTL